MMNHYLSDDGCLLVGENLRVAFGDLVAVDGVSLSLRAGELVGLIGPNGAGKTTLMRALCGLQPPAAGRALVMGRDVLGADPTVRRHIGFAAESPPLYEEMTVEQFLWFIANAYGLDRGLAAERIDFWLEQLWLTEKCRATISQLSRGMRQRVLVARTLVPNPNVVLLDEPSAGLDPAGRAQFRKVLASLRDQGKALIVSSHILADLEEYCTHIAIIEHGRIIRYGTVGELHERTAGRTRYRMTLAGTDQESWRHILLGIENVTEVAHENGEWTLEYDEGAEAAATVLRALIAQGVPVTSFTQFGQSLEQLYLRSGVRQVD